jgi:Cu/Ag efflux protein CusF
MKKLTIFLFVALFAAAFSFGATATTAKSTMKAHYVTGTVKSVDATAKTVTLTISNADKTFNLNDKTVYMKSHSKATAKMEDIKVGDKISVDADKDNNALRVIVASAPAAAKPAATTKTPATPQQ